jgi:hypothetical protein
VSDYEVGDYVEFPWYPGALYQIDHIDEPVSMGSGVISYVSSTGQLLTTTSYPKMAPSIVATLIFPAPGQRWDECPERASTWHVVAHKLKYVPEMGVLAYYAAWYPAPFMPDRVSVWPWKKRIDPPKRYDVRRRIWRHQHRGAA